MMNFLELVNEANALQARFSESYLEDATDDPMALLQRFQELKRTFNSLKPKLERIQSAREELVANVGLWRGSKTIVDKLPEIKEQFENSERLLEITRRNMRVNNTNVGRQATQRSLMVDRDLRLASAMNATQGGKQDIALSSELFERVETLLKPGTSVDDLQSVVGTIVRCGGKVPKSSIRSDLARALIHLDIVEEQSDELKLSRKYGVLLL